MQCPYVWADVYMYQRRQDSGCNPTYFLSSILICISDVGLLPLQFSLDYMFVLKHTISVAFFIYVAIDTSYISYL